MRRITSGLSTKWSNAAAGASNLTLLTPVRRGFRSPAALEALEAYIGAYEREQEKPRLVLYNYPSFAGSFAALFAHLYHAALNLPCLVLPFSSVEPLRVADFRFGDIQTCYMLDFVGPKDFAGELAKIIPRVIAFDHRLCTLSRISNMGKYPNNLELRIDTRKSSARASLEYFSDKFSEEKSSKKDHEALLVLEDQVRVETMIRYIEDADLRRWELVGIKEFEIGIREARGKLNILTNPHVFEQLLELDADDLIAKGKSYVASRLDAVNKLLAGSFKIRLGRGLYGECLILRVLLTILDTSNDPTALAVACYDLSQFIRYHPAGRIVVSDLKAKERVMKLMNHENAAVTKNALLCAQRLFLGAKYASFMQS